MNIGYLTSASSSFSGGLLRGESAAIEALGHRIQRYSLRSGAASEDPTDLAEQRRTAVVLEAGAKEFALAVGAALRRPQRFLSSLGLAVRSGRRSVSGVRGACAGLAEACLLLRWCRRDEIDHLYVQGGESQAVALLAWKLGGPSYSSAAAGADAVELPSPGPATAGATGALTPEAVDDPSAEAARKVAVFAQAVRDDLCAIPIAALHDAYRVPTLGPTHSVLRWCGARVWQATDRDGRNRDSLYGGEAGLRIVVFHLTPREPLDTVKRVVEWWQERWPMAAPGDADALIAGRLRLGDQDRLLVTFDDGLARHYEAAAWLAKVGVQAQFFVIPSLLDRTIAQFVRYHADHGVRAVPPVEAGDVRGLSMSQVREMLAMGHRIAAHNYAHRDLGRLHAAGDLHYEIEHALARVEDLTGAPCRDFAIGFGQPENLSPEAAQCLQQRGVNVYMCHRGLNVPGRTPRFLLRHAHEVSHPLAFTKICLRGGADHYLADRMSVMRERVGVLPAYEEAAREAGESLLERAGSTCRPA